MVLPLHAPLCETRRIGRVALTALLIGIGATAIAAMPLGNPAFAGNGNGGGQGHDGGHGAGNGGRGGGKGNGNSNGGGGQGQSQDGSGSGAKAGKCATNDASSGDSSDGDSQTAASDDDSMSPHNLGKLNGFFHASPNGLANVSPNSPIGRISHAFKDALSDFAAAGVATDPDASTSAPSAQDLGAILAGATNKKVTAAQVKAVIDRLAAANPEDASLRDLADSVDDATCQDIADAANASNSNATLDGPDGDGPDGGSTVPAATN